MEKNIIEVLFKGKRFIIHLEDKPQTPCDEDGCDIVTHFTLWYVGAKRAELKNRWVGSDPKNYEMTIIYEGEVLAEYDDAFIECMSYLVNQAGGWG